MKMIFSVITGLAFTILSLVAQEKAARVQPATEALTNKVEIEELLKLPGFTNETGMVLVKISDVQWVGVYEVTQ